MDTLIKLQADENEMDETEYLLQDPQHKAELLEAVENVKKGNLTTYTLDEIKSMLHE